MVALLGIGGLGLLLSQAAPVVSGWMPGQDEPAAETGAPGASAHGGQIWTERWRLGVSRTWTAALAQDAKVSRKGKVFRDVNLKVGGPWRVTPTDQDGARLHLQVLFEATELKTNLVGAADLETLWAELRTPFYISVHEDGGVADVHLAPEVSPTGERILRTLLGLFLYTDRPQTTPDWSVEEADATGTYLAAYTREPESVLHRRHEGYEVIETGGADAQAGGAKVTHHTRFELGAQGWPRTISATQTHEQRDGFIEVNSEVTARFEGFELETAPSLRGAFSREGGRLIARGATASRLAHEGASLARRQWDAARVAGRNLGELLAPLQGLGDSGDEIRQAHQLQGTIAGLMRQDPEAAPAAAAEAMKQPGRVRNTVIGALAQVDSEEAHLALRALLKAGVDSEDPDLARGTMMALTLAARASREAGAQLLAVADNSRDSSSRNAAALAAGGQSRTLSSSDPEGAARIAEGLAAMHARAAEAREQATLVAALGNSANPAGLSVIMEATRHPVWQVRMAAVFALRFFPGEEVDGLIRQALLHDSTAQVRTEAVTTLPWREVQGFVGPLSRTIVRDPEVAVRGAALSLFDGHAEWIPRFVQALAIAGQNDPDPGLRARAQTFLGSVGG